MYSNVERACILAGLDPFIGIMHIDNYNRQVFVFDLIEMYRIYIDQIVFKLFSAKKIKKEYFDKIELQNIIQYDCHNIANRILKDGE